LLAVDQGVAANPAAPGDVWYRGAPVASAARECQVTVPRNVDRVRNPAGFGGIGGAPVALVGNPGERIWSTTTHRKPAVGEWSAEYRPRRR
jgi:hypothetical protein